MRRLAASAKAMLVAALALAMVLPGQDAALSQTSGGPQVPLFTVIDLGDGAALGISGAQQQVGKNAVFDQARGGSFEHAMLWSGTAAGAVDLNPNGFAMSQANGTSGVQQVGWGLVSQFGPPLHRALLWRGTAGSVVDLSALLPPGFTFSEALGTDSSNNIVGLASGPASPNGARALLWKGAAGGVVDLTPPGATGGAVAAGTAGTQQVGYGYVPDPVRGFVAHALLWSGAASSAVDLNPTGFISSQATGVSGQQQVGWGSSLAARARHALLWSGTASSAVDLNPTGFTESFALGISGGQQVGYGSGPATGGFASHALLWRGSADSVVDLHTFLPSGFSSSQALGIDSKGNIVGVAGGQAVGGHAFLWKPAQVPVLIIPGLPGSWTPRIRDALAAGRLGNTSGVVNIPGLAADLRSMLITHLTPEQLRQDAVYDDLINTLTDKGIDVFVMPWDWANGGYVKAAADLDQFIRDHHFDKIDIIAHSAGGLVAQQYVQDRLGASANPRIRNLILLGSPNQGTLTAHCGYYLQITPCMVGEADRAWWRLHAGFFQLILNFPGSLAVAQSISAIHDIMPTFPYLQLDRARFAPFVPFDNAYLRTLNQKTIAEVSQFRTVGIAPYAVRGTALNTPGLFTVHANRNPLRPWFIIGTVTQLFRGDGAVLDASAMIPGFNDVPVPNATHVRGLFDCIKEAYPRLRDTGVLVCDPQVRRANTSIYIQTASPVSILLADPNGHLTGTRLDTRTNVADIPTSTFFVSDHPGIFIETGTRGRYTLDVLGTGSGEFELSIAYPNAFPAGSDASTEYFSGMIRTGERMRFVFDALAFADVTHLFAAFQTGLEINRSSRAFEMNGTFTLGRDETISPLTQAVTIQVGDGFLVVIPAGSFRSVENGRSFSFEGFVDGVHLEARLTRTGGNSYSLRIGGERARNLPTANPVEVRLAIGDNGGRVLVNADHR